MNPLSMQHMEMAGPTKAVCHCCGDIKHLSAFSKSDHGNGLSTVCDECRQARKLAKKSAKVKSRNSRKIDAFAQQISRRNMGLPRLGELAVGILRQFGGIESFCVEWYQNIQRAEAGSKTRLDQYKNIGQLLKFANEQVTPSALDDMDDDELLDELQTHLQAVGKLIEITPDESPDDEPLEPEVDHGAT